MKKSNIMLVGLLLVLVVIGWGSCLRSVHEKNTEYNAILSEANKYYERGLFQKAISRYEDAVAIHDSVEIRDILLKSYRSAYDIGAISSNAYKSALGTACEKFPQNADYWELFLDFCLEIKGYSSAYDACVKCEKAGVQSSRLHELKNEILYSYRVGSRTYAQYYRSPDGYYTVMNNRKWGLLNSEGEVLYDVAYTYISPVSTDCNTVLLLDEIFCVVDKQNVVQANLDVEFDRMRAVNGQRIPICINDSWRIFDFDRMEFTDGAYDEVSIYSDGTAAVLQNGKWRLINKSGDCIVDKNFDAIKLYGNGEFAYLDRMVASIDHKFSVYNLKGEQVTQFECLDADVYMGSEIAYRDATGKWGYINLKGEICIEPQFDEAKSFSNGLAAVKKGNFWGFINSEGEIVIDFQFLDADYFNNEGLCMVSTTDDSYCFIELRFPN